MRQDTVIKLSHRRELGKFQSNNLNFVPSGYCYIRRNIFLVDANFYTLPLNCLHLKLLLCIYFIFLYQWSLFQNRQYPVSRKHANLLKIPNAAAHQHPGPIQERRSWTDPCPVSQYPTTSTTRSEASCGSTRRRMQNAANGWFARGTNPWTITSYPTLNGIRNLR